MNAAVVRKYIKKQSDKKRATLCARFFKTGKGEYGEGDIFVGLTMPMQRIIAKQFRALPLAEAVMLLHSKIHEERMVALLIMVDRFTHASTPTERVKVYKAYIHNKQWINNWDLVDVTAPKVVGSYLVDKPRDVLYTLARSKKLWDRRIAIISTLWFIQQKDFNDTLAIATELLYDSHDLIHKAVGWMLREVGKRDVPVLHAFLKKHAATMPRTMLRYAIEKFPEPIRLGYLKPALYAHSSR